MTFILGIPGFHNCQGCSDKVRDALRKIGVEMVKLDRESGNVTVSGYENREAVRYALERRLKKSVVILSRDEVPAKQNTRPVVSRHVPAKQTLDFHQGLGQVALSLAREGRGVEIRTKDTIGTNFISRETKVVVMPETHGDSSDRDPQKRHHSRHGQPKNQETRVVVRQETLRHNNHPESKHHHGKTSNRETQVVAIARHETHGNINSHPQRNHHNSHHGQPQNRSRHH